MKISLEWYCERLKRRGVEAAARGDFAYAAQLTKLAAAIEALRRLRAGGRANGALPG